MNAREEITRAIIEMGFSAPTPIQAAVIPHMIDGCDCLAEAPTGSGKTCAFAIPALNNIDYDDQNVQVLIMCPTRELVMQTETELKKVAKFLSGVKILAIYGGQNIERQLSGLRRKPQVVVGTPGRIMDHLRRRTLKLEGLKTLVLDEADEMLNMGFRDDINVILLSASEQHQTVMFSATMSKDILEISKNYQTDPVCVKTYNDEKNIPKIEQFYVNVAENKKVEALVSILDQKCYELVLAFCNTKARVDSLSDKLSELGYRAEALHGDLRQRNRDTIMKRYRGGDINILVATDVAARGIDVEGIEAIFNFDVPYDNEYYIHRIGRTGRANKLGESYSFFSQNDAYKRKEFEKFTGVKMKESDIKVAANVNASKSAENALDFLGGDLKQSKDSLDLMLREFNLKQNTNYTHLDLAAAIVKSNMQGSQMPENNSRSGKPIKSNKTSTRYFLNIGLKDNLTERSLTSFVTTNTEIDEENVKEVKLLETFSFVEVENGFDEEMLSLNGEKIARRVLTVELADSAGKGASPKGGGARRFDKKDGKPFDRNRKPMSGGGKFAPKREGGFDRGDKPYAKSDKPFERSDKPYAKSDKPYAKSDKPYAKSDKPFVKSDKPFAKSDKPFERSEKSFDKKEKSFSGREKSASSFKTGGAPRKFSKSQPKNGSFSSKSRGR